jgi:hypothetical protein
MPENTLKSAYELAIERLRRKDAEDGATGTPLTEQQKIAIGEARTYCEAKLAELRILHQAALGRVVEPDERTRLEEDFRREAQRLVDDRERRIERLRQQS